MGIGCIYGKGAHIFEQILDFGNYRPSPDASGYVYSRLPIYSDALSAGRRIGEKPVDQRRSSFRV